MINILAKELAINGISFKEGTVYYCGEISSYEKIIAKLDNRIDKNYKFLRRLSQELAEELRNPTAGSSDKKTRRMFTSAVKSIYSIFLVGKLPLHVIKYAKNILNSDSGIFSSKFMFKIIDFNLGMQWLMHLIRKDTYVIYLLHKYVKRIQSKRVSLAAGFAGPWGRLDLPMEERVFEWGDVAEESAGRETDKKTQRRYRMGLENIQDNWPNEGFYWREIRNEPFAWGDEDSNPYPHRNLLWRS